MRWDQVTTLKTERNRLQKDVGNLTTDLAQVSEHPLAPTRDAVFGRVYI